MARILIVGGGCRGRRLARELVRAGHVLRITTREETGRRAIEQVGAECWIGDPDRLATLRGALDSVTVACWLLARASGPEEQLRELHGSRLERFMTQLVDTAVRGFVYEQAAGGERIAREIAGRNAIPLAVLAADPGDDRAWLAGARAAVDGLLAGTL